MNKCTEAQKLLREVFTDWKTWTPFCHGSPVVAATNIIRDGEIRPRQCSKEKCRTGNYDNEWESNKELVYLGSKTEKICYDSALSKFNLPYERPEGGGQVFFIDNIPDPSNLEPDEDFDRGLGYWVNTTGENLKLFKELAEVSEDYDKAKNTILFLYGVPPASFSAHNEKLFDMIKKCDEEDIVKFLNSLPEWTKSLVAMKTVAYRGTLPIDRKNMQYVEERRNSKDDWIVKLREKLEHLKKTGRY